MTTWWGWRVGVGRIRRLPTVVSFHPKAGLIIPVSGLDEVAILLEMVAPLGLMAATVGKSAISATVYKEGVRHILLT